MSNITFRVSNNRFSGDERTSSSTSSAGRDSDLYSQCDRHPVDDYGNRPVRNEDWSRGRSDSPVGAENDFRKDYKEKFGHAARQRQKVEEYRRWEMGQLLYGPQGRPSRQRAKPMIVTAEQFESVMKEICELYDIDIHSIQDIVPDSKHIVSTHGKGCFICRLCHHTWASEMSWVDIDLWERCISVYYQQKCMHCCEEKESAAIPMFTETQQRRLICRSFLRSGIIRVATLSMKVFLAGPAKTKTTVSRPHLGLLCGKCGYDSTDLPPCSAAQHGKDQADKKLSVLYDDMCDKASPDVKPTESGEVITIANSRATNGVPVKIEGGEKLRRPKCESASFKRPRFKTFNSDKPRLSVHDRLGPVNDVESDGPPLKRPRKPITFDGLSPSPDDNKYVGAPPDVKPVVQRGGQGGRRQKYLLLSHMERATAKSRSSKAAGGRSDSIGSPMDEDEGMHRPVTQFKKEKPWQQYSNQAESSEAPAESRTEDEWLQHCMMRVEGTDGDVEYMYTVNPDGDLFDGADGQAMDAGDGVSRNAGDKSHNEDTTANGANEEQMVVGLDGQPMKIKSEKEDPAYYAHLAGRKPVRVKEELPWMQGGENPYEDDIPSLETNADEEQEGGRMFLVEDADGEVEYLYTTYPEPDKFTIDDEEEDEDDVEKSSSSRNAVSRTVAEPSSDASSAAVAEDATARMQPLASATSDGLPTPTAPASINGAHLVTPAMFEAVAGTVPNSDLAHAALVQIQPEPNGAAPILGSSTSPAVPSAATPKPTSHADMSIPEIVDDDTSLELHGSSTASAVETPDNSSAKVKEEPGTWELDVDVDNDQLDYDFA